MEKVTNSDTSVDNDLESKVQDVKVDVSPDGTTSLSGDSDAPTFDPTRTKKLLRKLDWHLVPFLALLYL
jgi:hypothetical protein